MALSTFNIKSEEKRQKKNSDFSFAARKQWLEVLLIMLLFWKVKL